MSSLLPNPISTPAQRMGQVDATHERTRPCARSLEQAFGPYARNCVVVPMDTEQPIHPADVLVLKASAICVLVLVAIFTYEWITAL